jgi:GntR family transcriptional regulator, arabinose operon transcriptional repressor
MEEDKLLYKQIVNYLKNEITSQALKPGDRLPTEMELSNQFNVSRITSKRALEELKNLGLIYKIRGSGSYVSDLTEQAKSKEESINEDKLNTSRIISILLPFDISIGGLMNSLIGASKVLNQKGYYLSVHCSDRDLETEKQILLELYEKKIGGIIFYPISDRKNLETLNLLYLNNYPIVTIDKYYESIPISYVVSDNQKGAYDAAKYLIEHGHERIAFVSDENIESATSIRNRYFGYCKALKEYNLPINNNYVKVGFITDRKSSSFRDIYERLLENLLENQVTAICAVNDYVAAYLLHAASVLQIDVPSDLSIVGFDNIELTEHLSVPLTTIKQNFYQMGNVAAKLLIESIENGVHECCQIQLPTTIVKRNSCSTPKI